MADISSTSRNQVIIGLCLPLAVLLGYLLKEPLDPASLGLVLMVMGVLSIPILMRWHHPLLVLSWNACINPVFLPGRPYLWMLMSLASCFFAVLSRATNANKRFLKARPVSQSLLFLALVVAVTAQARGVGLHLFGSEQQGGKGYIYIGIAVIGYFAFTSTAIPKGRAALYVGMFFLMSLTAMISNLAYFGGPEFYFLYYIFPPDLAISQAMAENSPENITSRIIGLSFASQGIWCWLLARYGLGGMFEFHRPWRMLLLVLAVVAGMLGGFRSSLLFFLLVTVILFWLEKLWRSARVLVTVLTITAGLTAGLLLFAEKLPPTMQRAISFLPVKVDTAIRMDAEGSVDWRVNMWRNILPEVPRYLLLGKGYSVTATDLYMAEESVRRGFVSSSEVAMVAGDYHNGPLSVIVPFGIGGVIAFTWFLGASLLAALRNYRYGDPELRLFNRFILALLITRIVFFFTVFGSLYSDLPLFIGLVGLSICLNGGIRLSKELEPANASAPGNSIR